MAAIDLGVALLTAEALHVHDGHAKHRDLAQGLFDGLELGGLDDGEDEFHSSSLSYGPCDPVHRVLTFRSIIRISSCWNSRSSLSFSFFRSLRATSVRRDKTR